MKNFTNALKRTKLKTPPTGYIEGGIINNRTWIKHPTKGWRTRAIRPQGFDERNLHPLVIAFRRICARAGFTL